jgi:hypothetical protein
VGETSRRHAKPVTAFTMQRPFISARATGLQYPSIMHFDLFHELTVPDFTIRNDRTVFQETFEEHGRDH